MNLPRTALAVAASAAALLFAVPLVGLLAHAPWSDFPALLGDARVRDALALSFAASAAAVGVAIVLGMPLALWLASGRSALRTVVRTIVLLPVVLPPIVAGIALLAAFGRNGLVGAPLAQIFGVTIPFTRVATVVAAAYMGLPFFVLAVESGLRAFDARWLDMARSLGAGPIRRFAYVTLPMIFPSVATGMLLCFMRALGEYCATQLFAGNLEGVTRTLPLACGLAMETDPRLAIALSLLLSGGSVAVLLLLKRRLPGAR